MSRAVLITGAGGPLGANVTRSLRRGPERRHLVGTDANRWHLPLALTDVAYLIPLARDRDGYLRALSDIIAREGVDVIIPTHPVEVRAMAELRDAGALDSVATALPRTSVLVIADDKAATYARLAAAGVPVPRTTVLERPEDLERVFAEYGAPVWIRGSGAPGLGIGGASLPCREPGIARAWIDHHRGWGGMAASEFLPGDNLSWMAGFAAGRLVAAGCRQRLEYVLPHVAPSGITGAPAVSRTVDRPDVAAIGERAVRAIDEAPHGVYFVDLKGDAAGQPRVTEINAGRCGTTVEAYSEAGFNFPAWLVRLARGETGDGPADPHRAVEPDVYWVRTLDCGPVALRGDAAFDGFPRAGFSSE
ncbi:MAG TPA: hypothetical protein VML75_10050 [Kofleriaceae bacterium]|nr:hypothetical protein [Kofleriaceae bacterium]